MLRVFENGVPRKIFGPEMEEVIGDWRRQHKTKLYDLNHSPNIIRGTKSRIMRWTELVAHMGRGKVHTWGKEATWKTLA
jgi:hypothetical protein